MSATHTGGHQRRWQAGGGQNADEKEHGAKRLFAYCTHIPPNPPSAERVNRRLNAHTRPDTDSKEIKYTNTHIFIIQ